MSIPFLQTIGFQEKFQQDIQCCAASARCGELMQHSSFTGMLSTETAREAVQKLYEEIGEDPDGVLMLTLQLLAVEKKREEPGTLWHILTQRGDTAEETRRRPKETGFSGQRVFEETMGCFPRFVREYRHSYGHDGFDRWGWTIRQINGTLVRLGALEFEFSPWDHRVYIHIPGGTDLSADSIADSLRQEIRFAEAYEPDFAGKDLHCESWLLSPVLRQFLPEGSRILAFQNLFDITETNPEDNAYLEWAFGLAPGQIEHAELSVLQESTSLQRSLKQYVLQGGRVGSGAGILKR